MPIGCITNSLAVALGGVLGAVFGKYLPERVRESLPNVFGFSAMLIGVTLMTGVHSLSVVILSLIVGTILGELCCIERRIDQGLRWAQTKVLRGSSMTAEQMNSLLSVLVLFCTSGTGIFGALNEGMTGDGSVLLAKTILDLPTAAIFATSLGLIVAAIAIPQCIIFMILFFSAGLIVPVMSPTMIADFSAVGGVLTFIAGFRILGIKQVRLTNMLPALLLAPAVSALFTMFGL